MIRYLLTAIKLAANEFPTILTVGRSAVWLI